MTPDVQRITDVVAAHFGTTRHAMLEQDHTRRASRTRHIAMYLCRELTGASWPDLGKQFCRDHSVVWHGHKNIGRLIGEVPFVAEAVKVCRDEIQARAA